MFVVNSLSVVINERLSSAFRNRAPVADQMLRIFKNLLPVGLCYFLFFVALSPPLFDSSSGEKYGVSGTYAQVLALTFAVRIVVVAIYRYLCGVDRIKEGSFVQYVHFLLIGGYFFIKTDDEMLWLSGYTILEIVFMALYLVLIFRGLKSY